MPDTTLPYKPIIYSAPTFDVTQGCTITFTYLGGVAQSNTIVFKNNTTNETVYTLTTTTNQLKCEIPPNATGLENGGVYNITIQVRESATTVSQVSAPVVVYCFSTPTFTFSAPTVNAIVPTSYVEAILVYNQAQDEPLDRYSFTLYDSNNQLISSSDDLYDTTSLSYVFNNLIDDRIYSIKAFGVTKHNINLEATVSFSVNYEEPSVYTFLALTNVPETGSISIAPNIVIAEGSAYPDPPTYIDNSAIDLRAPHARAVFNDGFMINNNFVVQMIGWDFTPFSQILRMGGYIFVEYRIGNFASWEGEGDCGYFELKVSQGSTYYVGMSNYFDVLTPSDVVYIWLRHYNGAFEIKAEIINQEGGE